MAKIKKIRFPLEMENGVMVRTIEELKDNFSLEKILVYIANGKLQTWLRDRYLDDIADAILALEQDEEYEKKICNIFDVEYDEKSDVDMEVAIEKQRKLTLLKEYTDDENFYEYVDQMAFDQDDIYDLLDEGATTIYLCGGKFSIPISKKSIRYIGVNVPIALIPSKEKVNFEERKIVFENIVFDENYQIVLNEYEKNEQKTRNAFGGYVEETYLKNVLNKMEHSEAKKCYEMVSDLLESLNYDDNADINNLKKYLLETELETWGASFLQNT